LSAPELYPAVDILDGRAVRLVQGDFSRKTEYAADPLDAAGRWVAQGARWLHVVDLDGARAGRPVNLHNLKHIASELDVPVQYGGGLRDSRSARKALDAGAARVVIGTAAFAVPSVLDELLEQEPERVAVAIDVRGGRVATGGWTEATDLEPRKAVEQLAGRGVQTFIYTDIDRDGTLDGVATDRFVRLCAAAGGRAVLYSGGIGTIEHLRALAALQIDNLEGVIVGKALYEGRFDVAEARAALGAEGAA
jgi:phosphoribosylformimino-5-aminoimidazole carboxamide ribotide isomerase